MRFFEQVYALTRCIPPGRVASYGQIACLLEQPHAARTVGWAMRAIPAGSDVPWHRIVNAAGRISLSDPKQRRLLEAEGVMFEPNDRINMDRFGWAGLSRPEVEALLAQGKNSL